MAWTSWVERKENDSTNWSGDCWAVGIPWSCLSVTPKKYLFNVKILCLIGHCGLKTSPLVPLPIRFSISYIKILEPPWVLGNRRAVSLKCGVSTVKGLSVRDRPEPNLKWCSLCFCVCLPHCLSRLPFILPLDLGSMWNSKAFSLSFVCMSVGIRNWF